MGRLRGGPGRLSAPPLPAFQPQVAFRHPWVAECLLWEGKCSKWDDPFKNFREAPISDDAPTKAAYDVPPVTRAFALLRYIADGNRCRNMSRAASELSINRTTLIRLLHTLEREQMIEQDAQGGGYVLSFGVLELASHLLASRDIVRMSRPLLARLAAETGLSAHLGVLSGKEIIVLARETPDVQLVSNIREGSRLPAYATVMGRMILSHMPREEVLRLLEERDFTAITSQTPTTMQSLFEQLRTVPGGRCERVADGLEPVDREGLLDRRADLGVEPLVEDRDHHTDPLTAAGGMTLREVAELGRCGKDPIASRRGHVRQSVEGPTHGRVRDAGRRSDVIKRDTRAWIHP